MSKNLTTLKTNFTASKKIPIISALLSKNCWRTVLRDIPSFTTYKLFSLTLLNIQLNSVSLIMGPSSRSMFLKLILSSVFQTLSASCFNTVSSPAFYSPTYILEVTVRTAKYSIINLLKSHFTLPPRMY